MTIAKTIETARQHLTNGNAGAYARIMSGAVRAAASDRAANAYRAAMKADGFDALAAQA
ncbi:hypothetical protein KM176_16540 [Pseudooceanicola sp. CBS1P-1]|uniref:Uncharacterized protein n=1 Tax=Pseudooceanicola albus TaxID=2692189 RepID=A0A6L7G415_9RHOB|nr:MULTISPECIES: hypothetical protein [Pseudooceanicola]MBT9385484.1 hypothetical protein [Pseudooceanicola endophyticus]MXN19104.1 hypothetical protein [Pseudooceanicola albus]